MLLVPFFIAPSSHLDVFGAEPGADFGMHAARGLVVLHSGPTGNFMGSQTALNIHNTERMKRYADPDMPNALHCCRFGVLYLYSRIYYRLQN